MKTYIVCILLLFKYFILLLLLGFIFYKLILFWIASKPENVFAYNPIEDKFFNLIRKQIVQQSGLVYTQKEFDSTMP